ncbi:MAG: trypsin-like peptidase domain-containing protein [Pseudomonadota bacterium]|nr:trypsin-like peptidase domain-containing protein [Pseudomonadota bacterium]
MTVARFRSTIVIAITGELLVLAAEPAGALQPVSTGSGVAINPDGYIVTNNHVVTIDVKNRQGRKIGETICQAVTVKGAAHNGPVKIVARDRVLDIAVVNLSSNSNRSAGQYESRRRYLGVDGYNTLDKEFSSRFEEADRTHTE